VVEPIDALRVLTRLYATGVDREVWESDGVVMPMHELLDALFADHDPPAIAVRAALALRPILDLEAIRADTAIVFLARQAGIPWGRVGATVGVSKQAAQQSYVRRSAIRQEVVPPPDAPDRAWLCERSRWEHLRNAVWVILWHTRDLRTLSAEVAKAVYWLRLADLNGDEQQVLDRARDLVAAVRAYEERAGRPLDDVLSPTSLNGIRRLMRLVESADRARGQGG